MNYRASIVIASLFVLSLGLAITAEEEPDKEAPESKLRMSISATKQGYTNETPIFHVALENAGDKDVMLNLGMMLGNGKLLLPDTIHLILTDSRGESRELHFSNTRIAGRVDDYIIPLRSGSTHSLKLSLADYWCPQTKEFKINLKHGEYRIHAQLTSKGAQHLNADTQGMKLMNVWKGKLQSDATAFRIGKQG